MLDAPFDLAKEAASLKEQQAVALELLRKSLEAEGLRRRARGTGRGRSHCGAAWTGSSTAAQKNKGKGLS